MHIAIGKLPVHDFELILESYPVDLRRKDGQDRTILETAIHQACKNEKGWDGKYKMRRLFSSSVNARRRSE